MTESRTEGEIGRQAAAWREKGVALEAGGHKLETFLAADLIIPSPGASSLPQLGAAKKAGIAVISETELARRFLKGKVVGITGTNGKSTTATLAHKILKEAGLKARLAGNIGTPLVAFAAASRDDHIYVTEISSFQLEHVDRFDADVAVFLNISQNHLDWHGTFEDYFNAKKKLVRGQTGRGQAHPEPRRPAGAAAGPGIRGRSRVLQPAERRAPGLSACGRLAHAPGRRHRPAHAGRRRPPPGAPQHR